MVVLVTGGTRGIGKACVRAFCERGEKVRFFYRSADRETVEALERETGAVGMKVDVSDRVAVREGIDRIIGEEGRLDVLVNNAGMAQIGLFTDLTEEDYVALRGTNLDGAVFCAQRAAEQMVRQHSGYIVNIGSMWGKTGASCEVAYSATKAGIRGLTMALAKELGPSGVTVNCVEPGVIDTDMNRSLDAATRAELCDGTPLCRLGKPEEVAAAVLFFASEAAGFITGQILGVDGGFAV